MKRLLIVVLGLVAFVGLLAVDQAAGDSGGGNKVHACYLFDPRFDDPLEETYFDPSPWRDKWIPEAAVSSYDKNRQGFHIMKDGALCPPFVQYFPFTGIGSNIYGR